MKKTSTTLQTKQISIEIHSSGGGYFLLFLIHFTFQCSLSSRRSGREIKKKQSLYIQKQQILFVSLSLYLSLSLVLVSYFWLHVVLSHPKKTSSSWRSFLFIFPLNVSSRTDSLVFSYYCCNLYALFKRFSIETAIFRVTLCECVLRTARLQSIILHITPTCRALALFRDAKKKQSKKQSTALFEYEFLYKEKNNRGTKKKRIMKNVSKINCSKNFIHRTQ